MKTPQQLKQWVRSAGSKRVIIRQWSTPEQAEFMRDSPSKREFDRLLNMLLFCDSIKSIDQIVNNARYLYCIGGLSDTHRSAIYSLAEQYKQRIKYRRTIKVRWRNLSVGDKYLISAVTAAVGTCVMVAALIGLILAIR